MSVVRAQEKQHYWYAEKEFFCRGVLSSIIDLFPHVQIVVRTSIEFEGYSSDPVEHKEGAKHVGYVR
jgi:hypothetical protein